MITVGLPFIIALGLALLNKGLGKQWLSQVALILLATTYLFILLNPFIMLVLNWSFFWRAVRNPLGLILDNSKQCAETDMKYIRYFYKHERHALKFVLIEMKAERSAFERRVGLIVGALEKIGIIPGLVALFATLTRINSFQSAWIYGIAYGMPILYFLGVYEHYLMSRLDRFIMLLEMVIESQKSEGTGPNNGMEPTR
jgi:hypothetical protein